MSSPPGWAETTLGEIADFVMGQAPPGADCNFERRGTPFVKAGEFGVERPIIREWTTRPLKLAQASDVLICVVGATAGKLNLGAACAIGRSVAAIRPTEATFTRFVYGRLLSEVSRLRSDSTGTAQGVISRDMLDQINICLPPFAEQRRIVAKLDALTARLARARGEAERGLALGSALREAALSSTCDAIAGAKEVEVASLAESTFDGPFGSNLKSSDYVPAGVRVVRLENIGHLRFLGDKYSFITKEKFASLTRHRLAGGDLLFSSFVDRKVRVCLFPDGEALTINKADCFAVRLDPTKCDRRFVAYMLAAPTTYEALKTKVHGATRPRIGLRDLRALRLSVPPLAEQVSLADRLDAAFAHADRLEAEARKALALIDRLEAAILAKAFRGELVPQDLSDEPASVLLERIRARRAAEPAVKRGRKRKAA